MPEIRARLTLSDGDTLVIRPLRAGDGPALQRFNAALSEASRGVFLPHAYDEATVARMIARADAGTDLTYVAVAGADIVGYFFLWDIADPVPSLGIGLAEAYQNRGLGAHCLQLLIDDARAAGCDGIDLTTVPTNARAFALYRKMGFRYLADVDNIAGDGRVVRERWMFLPLRPGAQPPTRQHQPPPAAPTDGCTTRLVESAPPPPPTE